eukprot:TRINITY_DN40648_c0_g1_i1.p2 TRINITY_DN40648_c0_g1~~TRINITY_DN40648_c0_g1_i1.p2  ORF type:complete len:239 (+),score=56.39 TRINITY_DN40648_c0_g1_i1:85-801(+)
MGLPLRLSTTSTRNAEPFLSKLQIQRWKARFPHWPPKDCSPVTPIEPWGKQFFVYNALPGVELRGDPRAPPVEDLRPAWLRDEDAASMLLDNEGLEKLGNAASGSTATRVEAERLANSAARQTGSETVLCCTDFRQRPLVFLQPDEWRELLRQLPALKQRLRKCQERVDALDERGAHMREYYLKRKYLLDKFENRFMGTEVGTNGSSLDRGRIGQRARDRMIRISTELLAESKADDGK